MADHVKGRLGTADFSEDGEHRYRLTRLWDRTKPTVCFICLNPSTATQDRDDPTITRCINYAIDWGYGGLHFGNIFALRSTDPAGLYEHLDPVGPENMRYLRSMAAGTPRTIAAWGNHGTHLGQGEEVLRLLAKEVMVGLGAVRSFGLTQRMQPRHPLYLRKTADTFPIEALLQEGAR